MTQLGYALSSEEHTPLELVRLAQTAEETGFSFAMISDHIHPWIDRQGNSSFVWSVLGAIATATESLSVGTGVTCPIIRNHPINIAHASATIAEMMPGRFWLGLGTGEALNEHVTGVYWPPVDVRREMLAESVDIIRALWGGEMVDYRGEYFEVVDTRLYTFPSEAPPIYIAAGGPNSAELAAEYGDGLISTAPDAELVSAFTSNGGKRKVTLGQVTVCWGEDEQEAREIAHELWPTAGLQGELSQELPLPRHYEQASKNVTVETVAEAIICGPDPQRHVEAIRKFVDAGFDRVYVHQVGPDQDGFFEFYRREVLPNFTKVGAAA